MEESTSSKIDYTIAALLIQILIIGRLKKNKKAACSLLSFQHYHPIEGLVIKLNTLFLQCLPTFQQYNSSSSFCCSSLVGMKTHRIKQVSEYKKMTCFFFLMSIYKPHHATKWCQPILEFFLNFITLYKPRMPSVLYIFVRASNIPLYWRFDGSTPALYCSTSRVFVTHIGFVIQRVMAPENRWKLD